ncbi:hypothetical protein M153_730009145 [Pseudoloma neurophilia]|uniref:Uncharacterized protein n=1 Tax=Pseudoloma neurophilia TaxID=146866 RepID=A0A0R0M089_9MICR|nr:hypothetical protein M153_730009145 [Pseudoloma neurophilia]
MSLVFVLNSKIFLTVFFCFVFCIGTTIIKIHNYRYKYNIFLFHR